MGALDGGTIDTIWNKVVDKGISIVLLIVALYFMYLRETSLQGKIETMEAKWEAKWDKAQDENKKMFIEVIQKNTDAFNKFNQQQQTRRR